MKVNNMAIDPEQSDDILAFYKDKYAKVNLITCEECGSDLAIEVLIPERQSKMMNAHHEGMTVIPIGNTLLASRKRQDGVMGYECRCGNDSRIGEAEKGVVGKGLRDMMPHERDMVDANLKLSGSKPQVTEDADGTKHVERFAIKRLK